MRNYLCDCPLAIEAQIAASVPIIVRVIHRGGFTFEVEEDLLQDVWLIALRRMPEGLSLKEAKYWLTTVARNRVIDEGRHQSRRPAWVELDESTTSSPADLRREEFVKHVRQALETTRVISVGERELIDLRFNGDMCHKEIAILMKTSESTIRRRISAALSKLSADPSFKELMR